MIKKKPLAISLGVSLGVGVLSALLTKSSMAVYKTIRQPPLSPPGWVFPVVWTALFTCMGVAAYRVWDRDTPNRDTALTLYGAQLIFNFLWTLIFFNGRKYGFALLWLVVLWALILATTVQFFRSDKTAGKLMIPYILWVTFAAYLNAGVWVLNK